MAPKLPSAQSLREAPKRGLAHHILANHELQALEVMAWTLDGYAPQEIAKLLDISPNTVSANLRHARRRLATLLPAQRPGGD